MIEVERLGKRYGKLVAVDGLCFDVRPGHVTGFLGPNGAGKSTVMRMILGLVAPSAGRALVGGRCYRDIRYPLYEVGALLDSEAAHPSRSAFDHLHCLALSHRIGRRRVLEVLEQVGLASVAKRKVGTFSLGMKQRLGVATALLGDPATLLFDEPVNGLDAAGVRWMRELMRGLAAEGRTVFLSSHLMTEMALTAHRLIIIGRGQLIADTSVAELASRFSHGLCVRSPRAAELAQVLEGAGATVFLESADWLSASGIGVGQVGDLSAAHGIPVHEMTPRHATLEDAYTMLTEGSVEYMAGNSPA